MQALVTTSRSISQDPFLQRETKRKYNQHIQKIQHITQLKSYPILSQVKQVQKLTKTLYKAKQSSKTFRENQQKTQMKRQNRLLLEKIWKINSNINTDNNVMHLQHQSGSNWYYKKRQAQTIKFQNKRLAHNLINTKTDVKEYKKKLENQIKEYLELRNNIRKFNYETEKKKTITRAQSEKKGFKLTLKQMEEDNNDKEIQKDKYNTVQNGENIQQKKSEKQKQRKAGKVVSQQKRNLKQLRIKSNSKQK